MAGVVVPVAFNTKPAQDALCRVDELVSQSFITGDDLRQLSVMMRRAPDGLFQCVDVGGAFVLRPARRLQVIIDRGEARRQGVA